MITVSWRAVAAVVLVMLGMADAAVEPARAPRAFEIPPITSGDFNGDGTLDFAIATDTSLLIRLSRSEVGDPHRITLAGLRLDALATLDLDWDGDLDLIGFSRPATLRVWRSDGRGGFSPGRIHRRQGTWVPVHKRAFDAGPYVGPIMEGQLRRLLAVQPRGALHAPVASPLAGRFTALRSAGSFLPQGSPRAPPFEFLSRSS